MIGKIATTALIAIAFATAAGPAGAGDRLDRRVIIVNASDSAILTLHGSHVRTEDWEEDILGNDILPSGDAIVVDFDDGTGFCMFDLKAEFENGHVAVRERVNVCNVTRYTFR